MDEYQGKPNQGQCQSYVPNPQTGKLEQCKEQGTRRTDNGLDSGIHCNGCWDKMLSECRTRSW